MRGTLIGIILTKVKIFWRKQNPHENIILCFINNRKTRSQIKLNCFEFIVLQFLLVSCYFASDSNLKRRWAIILNSTRRNYSIYLPLYLFFQVVSCIKTLLHRSCYTNKFPTYMITQNLIVTTTKLLTFLLITFNTLLLAVSKNLFKNWRKRRGGRAKWNDKGKNNFSVKFTNAKFSLTNEQIDNK